MITLAPISAADMPAAYSLYHSAFPPEERRQWQMIADPGSDPRLSGVYDGDRCVGFVTTWDLDGFVYVEHFAVDPACRSHGYGARALSALRSQCQKPIVLEVEPPEHPDPMAPRRIAFYRRCGFEILDYDYIQPPYAPGLPAVPLKLMSTDSSLDPAAVAAALHSRVYGVGSVK